MNEGFDALTVREAEVLTLIVKGLSAKQIARHQYVSVATVRAQIRAIFLKLHVTSQLAAVALVHETGWLAKPCPNCGVLV
jgi:two-component system nitrate/nitrite response regulator NarL